ncbi:Protein of uncharacterised function DUF262 [Moraxella veridica]|uniref:GmrSD restriction endonucleases N-terminal domain-containing protein n=2 Tax=Moraxellaceae TaxID=468 RepID=A0A7Z0UYH0_MORCA|nr:hypothetical protein AO382_1328 [Moraxella catarrhalis]STY82719.1 Protein of uncharacterised function DUF262 [Moraxella catarrhalis]
MSELTDNLSTCDSEEKSLFELLKENEVSIPKIQRDYAQGRNTKNIQYIREMFLSNLFEALSDDADDKKLKLDFIYGYEDQDQFQDKKITIFKPLDGQQRLTTLFLLHWYAAKKEGVSEDRLRVLKNFTYDTRKSSRDFCEKLVVDFQPDFGEEFSEQTADRIEKQIMNQNWFTASWKNDPTITSMLVMLKAIDKKFHGVSDIWEKLTGSKPRIVFHLLKMQNLGLPDDLYIKMNARGKPLTDFEHFKSQFSEILSGKLKDDFNNKIDQAWSDLFWDIFKDKENPNPDSDIAQKMDKGFLSFVWFITDILIATKGIEIQEQDFWLEIIKKVYSDTQNVEFLFDNLDFFEKLNRSNESNFPRFEEVFYIDQDDFTEDKVRLFFNKPAVNLFEKCVKEYRFGDEKNAFSMGEQIKNAFSMGEQILLYAYIKSCRRYDELDRVKLRKIRNLTSDTWLRQEFFKHYLEEVDLILQKDELSAQPKFSKRQFDEDKTKSDYIKEHPENKSVLYRLEDHHLLRGSISIFLRNSNGNVDKDKNLPIIDENFPALASKFLERFCEKKSDDEKQKDFYESISPALLTLGDYTQAYGASGKKRFGNGNHVNTWREIFTQSNQRSSEDFDKTKETLKAYLKFFIEHPEKTHRDMIDDYLAKFDDNQALPKDLNYYLIKYPAFHKWQDQWTQGFYYWKNYDEPYDCWMLFKRQFNGRHWRPFLLAITEDFENCEDLTKCCSIEDYRSDLSFNHNDLSISIGCANDGFVFKFNCEGNDSFKDIIDQLIQENILTKDNKLMITQDDQGVDLEDRIIKLKTVLEYLIDHY